MRVRPLHASSRPASYDTPPHTRFDPQPAKRLAT